MTENNFIDYIKIYAASGKGGKGSTHLRREKFVAKGGPDGGDGGRGGHIILRGNKNLWTLHHLRFLKHAKAKHGGDGKRSRSAGKNGEDCYIEVPLGTIVRESETNKFCFEMVEDGQEIILLKGGKGGKGNWHFKSATRQTPRYAQPGLPGKEGWFRLTLKILADVGLVGFPNAGKSTLLATLSAAKPKIADYPFTTLKPNLGIVPYKNYQSFSMADIPGIIEGANKGKGLGHYFLRHIERNAVLVFLVAADTNNIAQKYATLLKELKLYSEELMHKKRLLAISKSDLLNDELESKITKKLPKDIPTIFISSHSNKGLEKLKDALWKLLNMRRNI